ncbi:response regulator [Flavimaribacter sediminis]|uniref:response regulator n=1 Tax=Flavimaribacter sediminis TaxID=2865987 RepID=UPI00351F2085
MESEGYRCIVAHDQISALKLLENCSVDCALLDFDLGRETSADVALQLNRSGQPYVFVTGRSRDDIRQCLGSDVQVFSKPVNYADLANRLVDSLAA